MQATWSFTAIWTPTTVGETAPASVKVTLMRYGSPTVAGTGAAKVSAGTTDLVKVDSTSLWMSGLTMFTPTVVVTIPISAQIDGTYRGTATVTSDTVSVTYDALTSTATKCFEMFSLGDIVEGP